MLEKKTSPSTYSIKNPFYSSIKYRRVLNKKASKKKTYHVELSIEGSDFSYEEGDSIGVLAHNPPNLVAKILNRLDLKGHENFHSEKKKEFVSSLSHIMRSNVQKLNRKIIEFFNDFCPLAQEKYQLNLLLAPENKAELKTFTENYHLVDLLLKKTVIKDHWAELFNLLPPLLPRFYSIASSPSCYPNEIHLTIAKLEYEINESKRYGVCSHYLCSLASLNDNTVPIYLLPAPHFKLPKDPQTPIIMVGPGTGIAPFRAFMQRRHAQHAKDNWLFFGEWNRDLDFYYEKDWEFYQKEGVLRLDCAFSRDQENKVYVQDKINENGKEIIDWIDKKEACFYICGDAHNMAKAVEQALINLLVRYKSIEEPEARDYLKTLRKSGRLQKDVY